VLLIVSLVVFTVFRRRLLKILFFCVTVTAITLVLTRTGDRFLVSWILIAFIVFLEKVKYVQAKRHHSCWANLMLSPQNLIRGSP
jgi:hypothetical protein